MLLLNLVDHLLYFAPLSALRLRRGHDVGLLYLWEA